MLCPVLIRFTINHIHLGRCIPSNILQGLCTISWFLTSDSAHSFFYVTEPQSLNSSNSLAVTHGGFLDLSLDGTSCQFLFSLHFFNVLTSDLFLRIWCGIMFDKTGNHCVWLYGTCYYYHYIDSFYVWAILVVHQIEYFYVIPYHIDVEKIPAFMKKKYDKCL